MKNSDLEHWTVCTDIHGKLHVFIIIFVVMFLVFLSFLLFLTSISSNKYDHLAVTSEETREPSSLIAEKEFHLVDSLSTIEVATSEAR
jgi:hypothetical protein